MSTEKDLDFLEIQGTDSSEIRGMKSHLQMVMAMPEPERRVFMQEERVMSEEQYLRWMIHANHEDDKFIRYCTIQARRCMIDYNALKDEHSLELAELWAECAIGTKDSKYTIKDIRKQRERIWQEKRKLSSMKQQNAELSQSSNSLEN